MNILISVCARGGSKGIPRKALRNFCGEPLLARTVRQAHATGYPVVVSTEDDEIATLAASLGADVLDRPAELATDTASKWDVWRHIEENREFDLLVDLDICCPLRKLEDIFGALKMVESDPFAVIISAYPAERNPYFNMVLESEGGYASIVKEMPHPIHCRQDAPIVYSLSPAVFIVHKMALTCFEHWSKACMRLYHMPRERAIDLDSELDFQFAEWMAKHD